MISEKDVYEASERIFPFVKSTPILQSEKLNSLFEADVYFKCENFQHIGAFKARGAHNAVFAMSDEEASKGVATHSSGNHAAALSLAAKNRGISARIVMPNNSNKMKISQVEELGGLIEYCEPTTKAREEAAAKVQKETGAKIVHPYNDPLVIAGQATVALELLNEVPDLDAIVAPVGGGGLMAGTALITKATKPNVYTCGVEPEEVNDAARSLASGELVGNTTLNSIADGLRGNLGPNPFEILQKYLDKLIEVSEKDIVASMRLIWSELKIVIEPSSAVAIASLLSHRQEIKGEKVGVIITGGNVDLDDLPW